jgi:glucosamine--fructose-6-phosphate aminotransferase (isomerizing)
MSHMRDEARDSAAAVAACLAARTAFAEAAAALRALDPAVVMVSARGSSGHAGTFLRYLLARDLGVVAAAAMPSIASVYGRTQRFAGTAFLAISQSGRSPDLVRQAEAARDGGALTLAFVNDTASPLAAVCERVIDLAAGPELSVAATKTVLASMAAGLALTAAWSGDTVMARAAQALPERLAAAVALDWSPLEATLGRVDRLFTVARGPGLAVASEAALKLAEVVGVTGIAHSSAELAHGPRALAGPDFPVLAFVQDDAASAGTGAVLTELVARGVPVLAAGFSGGGVTALPMVPPSHADADLLPPLVSFYLAVEAAARRAGRDPDRPPGLQKVTRTL